MNRLLVSIYVMTTLVEREAVGRIKQEKERKADWSEMSLTGGQDTLGHGRLQGWELKQDFSETFRALFE